MKALLLADRDLGKLAPLTDHTCTAMLPVVGKSLVVHAVESLVAAGVRDMVVATSDRAPQVERELGDGSRFGAAIRYLPTRGNEGYDAIAARVSSYLGDEYVAMHADVLRSSFVGRFLSAATGYDGVTLRAVVAGCSAGLWRVIRGSEWNVQDIEIDGAHAVPVSTLAAFHKANIDAIQGCFPGLMIPGRQLPGGVIVRRQANLPSNLRHDGPVFAGQGVSVKSGVTFDGGVVLSDNVVVDNKTTLRNTVILPHTYVGPMVELENAIAWKQDLIRIDTGVVVHVSDPALLADLSVRMPGAVLKRAVDRVLGVALLALSLPLWPVMLLDSWRVNHKQPLKRLRLRGNRRTLNEDGRSVPGEFETIEAATHVPVLRNMPRILAVISGDLALIGVQPLTPETNDRHTEDWERVREGAPVGLLGPAPLGTPEDAPEEDKLLLEALYAETRTGWSDLKWLGKGILSLFTPRAWRLPIRF